MTGRMMALAALVVLLPVLAGCEPAPKAQVHEPVTVFTGGVIHTGTAPGAIVEAVAVSAQGRIVYAGEIDKLHVFFPVELARVDLRGGAMFAGFTDAHAHLEGIGQRELTLDLTGTASVDELVTRMEAQVQGLPEDAVLVGRGWIETGWPEGRMPVAADLDAVVGQRAVILIRSDGHALVASSAALARAGIDRTTPDPEGGRIERGADGEPNGLLIDTAMGPVLRLAAEPSAQDRERAYVTGAQVMVSRGWTGVHNMSVPASHAPVIAQLSQAGSLPLRLYNAFDADGFDLAAARADETPLVTNRAVKIYMDGALGSRGARLLAPYADRPGERGLLVRGKDETLALMRAALAANVQLSIHAIGDEANRLALDWVGEAQAEAASSDARWRIEHAQVLAPQDVARFAGLGLIASMQPSHAIGDLYFAPSRLGPERLSGAYAWRDVLDSGAVIAGGSDAPAEVGSPLIEFYAAVARRGLDGTQTPDWHPDQAVSRFEALRLLTWGPAYASFRESELGTIEVGKLADFTVFDTDLMSVPEADILKAKAIMAVVGGKVVFDAATGPAPQ